MKPTHLFSICLAIVLFGTSCKDKFHQETRLLIKNTSNIAFEIVLFPKSEYRNGKLYRTSDIGAGSNYTTFVIPSGSKQYLYYSGDFDIQPNALVSKIFDSIQMRPADQNQATIRFSAELVYGYPLNIFKDSSAWKFEHRTEDLGLYFGKTTVESNEYTMEIQSPIF